MITIVELLVAVMIVVAIYGLVLLCVAIPLALWREFRGKDKDGPD